MILLQEDLRSAPDQTAQHVNALLQLPILHLSITQQCFKILKSVNYNSVNVIHLTLVFPNLVYSDFGLSGQWPSNNSHQLLSSSSSYIPSLRQPRTSCQ